MMRTPDGHSRLELSRFLRPTVIAAHREAPANWENSVCELGQNAGFFKKQGITLETWAKFRFSAAIRKVRSAL
jgi:hypothetical protein